MRLLVGRVFPGLAFLACLLYLPKMVAPTSALYGVVLTPKVLDAVGAALKLSGLVIGGVFGTRAGLLLERDNPARPAWLLFGGWLAAFAVGQLVLATYLVVLRASAPLPSIGDVFFLGGYALAIVGAVWFVISYVRSGLPVGSPGEHAALAGSATLLFAVLGWLLLAPIARAEAPLGERLINCAYPALDLVVLVPTLLLARIAMRLRGGRVGVVWGLLAAGLVGMCAGDVLFAYFSSAGLTGLEPLVDAMFALGYTCAGWGAAAQYALARDL